MLTVIPAGLGAGHPVRQRRPTKVQGDALRGVTELKDADSVEAIGRFVKPPIHQPCPMMFEHEQGAPFQASMSLKVLRPSGRNLSTVLTVYRL